MKTFISYSTALDQIIALRLQTMAAVYGMTIYVPPASTRQAGGTGLLIPEVQEHLRQSDVVLAVITHRPTPSAVSEMNSAVTLRKLLIPIVGPGVPPEYHSNFEPYFSIDPHDPSQASRSLRRVVL
jgi:hypothetical protein